MIPLSPCVLYSRDDELVGRFLRIAASVATVHPVETQDGLEQWLMQFGDAVLLADLRAPNCLDVLAAIKKEKPTTIIVAMGVDRSDPMLAAEWLEPFATLPLEPARHELQAILRQSVECLNLRQKTRILEAELQTLVARQSEPAAPPRAFFTAPLQNFAQAQRNVDNIDMLFGSVVDGLVATARVSRAGIFMKPDGEDTYRFQAGTRCLATTEKLSIPLRDPFVRWLEMNTHLISRKTLENIQGPEERAMLKRMLDSLGAEIITPLYASGRIKGWIFVGQRSTGIPFDIADLEDLAGLADHISTTLEKALQYEETALQKALAETLLHSIPFGIVACDETATIRWFNSTAREILQTGEQAVIGQRAETLGSRIADLLRRAVEGKTDATPREWTDPQTNRTLSAEARRLLDGGSCVGAMVMLHDVTGVKLLQEKEQQLERAAFWNELASGMSHEIRNPLVAIKTFAQLLPKRYDDPDFRAEFSQQVTTEIGQLDHIIDKINEFANPPKPVLKPLDLRTPIEHAVARIKSEFGHENLKIHLATDDTPLQINGDAASMEECIYHLVRNATENLGNKPGSRIGITLKGRALQDGGGKIYVIVTDNGSGIKEALRDKLFSPFSTTKARGLGLGLPIAKRAVIDHNGQLDIETGAAGTTISMVFPALAPAK